MRDWLTWKVTLVPWRGFPCRVHVVFFVLAVLVGYYAWPGEPGSMYRASGALAVLLLSVGAHELAHVWTTLRFGGDVQEILLWPLGGLNTPSPPRMLHDDHTASQQELLVACAGPLANLTFCLFAAVLLWFDELTYAQWGMLFHPLRPPISHDPLQFFWMSLFWVNWVVFLANLLPAMPLDGARVVRALLWRTQGPLLTAAIVQRLTRVTGGCVILTALVFFPEEPYGALFLMLLGGIFLLLTPRESTRPRTSSEDPDTFLGYDFSQGYTSLERSLEEQEVDSAQGEASPGSMKTWWENRKAARDEKRKQQQAADEQQFDEILARIHEAGWEGLSEEQRAFARRYSQKLRKPPPEIQ